MPWLVVRCAEAGLKRLRAEACQRGLSLSAYARERLGLELEFKPGSSRPRMRLPLSLAQHAALDRAAREGGFATVSAYVRARLFLLPPPPPPLAIPRHSSKRHPLRIVLSPGDDRRIAGAARVAKLRPVDYVIQRIFGDVTPPARL